MLPRWRGRFDDDVFDSELRSKSLSTSMLTTASTHDAQQQPTSSSGKQPAKNRVHHVECMMEQRATDVPSAHVAARMHAVQI